MRKIRDTTTEAMGLSFGGQIPSWDVAICDIGGRLVAYARKFGWAWDLTTGKDGYVRWNKTRANATSIEEEEEQQLIAFLRRIG